jgi:hypothetical protein|tara:strand:- start:87 stop:197 length:111 start_codon:yes stop_codon:yes gene_type:complete
MGLKSYLGDWEGFGLPFLFLEILWEDHTTGVTGIKG